MACRVLRVRDSEEKKPVSVLMQFMSVREAEKEPPPFPRSFFHSTAVDRTCCVSHAVQTADSPQ